MLGITYLKPAKASARIFRLQWLTIPVLMVLFSIAPYAAAQSQVGSSNQSVVAHSAKSDELLVKMKPGKGRTDFDLIAQGVGAATTRQIAPPGRARQSVLGQWFRISLGRGASTKRVMEKIAKNPNVETVELNYLVTTHITPNDPDFSLLWGLHNTGQASFSNGLPGTEDADIDAPEAWNSGTGDSALIIAVVDTGVDYTHSDIASNVWTNAGETPANGLDDDGNGFIDDVHGYDFVNNDGDPMDDNNHGTHVAGIAAASGNDGTGIAGVTWTAQIMALKAQGASGTGNAADAASAIGYAVSAGARVINLSFGGPTFSQALYDAVSAANDANVLVVASAGNDNSDNDTTPDYPSSFDLPNLVSVAATDRYDARAEFSNYGQQSVDLGAPGDEIYSTVPGDAYAIFSGTSQAAPHVSGAGLLALAQDPSLTGSGLRSLLIDRVDSTPAMFGITLSGGRLNVNNVLTCDISPGLSTEFQSPEPGFSAYTGESIAIRLFLTECGRPVTDASISVAFDQGDADFNLYDDGQHGDGVAGDGIYGAYWQPANLGPATATVTIDQPSFGISTETVSGEVRDRIGYRHEVATYSWIDATTGTSHSLSDDGAVTVPIGFDFPYFGVVRNSVTVNANGFITFGPGSDPGAQNTRLPDPASPNAVIAPFWDDLDPGQAGMVYTFINGVSPNRRFTAAWVGVPHAIAGDALSFEVTLYESTGDILFQYQDVDVGDSAYSTGANATVGVEDDDGLDGTGYIFNQALLTDQSARRFVTMTPAPEIPYRVSVDIGSIRSTNGALALDFIDGDGNNNNQTKIFEFATDGDISVSPWLSGDASGTLVPGPGRIGDAQFFNEIFQPVIHGDTLSFLLNASLAGTFSPFPDTFSFYLLDSQGLPYPTDDPSGANSLFVIEIDGSQPTPEIYHSDIATADVSIVGQPIADPGGPYTSGIGQAIQFDGSASADPEGGSLNYAWDFGDGNTGMGVNPTHTYASTGQYTVELVVDDGEYYSLPATTTATVSNITPVANAGADQTVYGFAQVQLDGTSSSDADGSIISYSWSQTSGPVVQITGADTATPTYASPDVTQETSFTFSLTVTDDYGASDSDSVTVTALPYDIDQDGDGLADGWEVTYFGDTSAGPSDDSDGDGITNLQEYQEGTDPTVAEPPPAQVTQVSAQAGDTQNIISWSPVQSASAYDIYWATSPGVSSSTGTLIADVSSPYTHGGLTNLTTYYYVVVARNNSGAAPASPEVSATPNAAPVADPGGPYQGEPGVAIAFDGSGSSDPEGAPLTYSWDFGDGNFGQGVNPTHTYVTEGTYTVTLVVNDDHVDSIPQSTTADVLANVLPIADAGTDQMADEGITVTLDGSQSNDSDGTIASYVWTQELGPSVNLTGADTAQTSFVAPDVSGDTTLRFRLTVTDDDEGQASDTVDIVVTDLPPDADGDGMLDTWERMHFGSTAAGPGQDPDGDGISNLQEFEEDTDPNSPEPAPAPVTNVDAVPGDTITVIAWQKVNSVAQYDLYWDTNPGVTPSSGTPILDVSSPFEHTGRTNGLKYHYVLVARNNSGQSISTEVSASPGTREWAGNSLVEDLNGADATPRVAMNALGQAVAVWVAPDATSSSVWFSQYEPAQGWTAPTVIDDSSQSIREADIAFNDAGEAIAVWSQNDGSGVGRHDLWARNYKPDSGWGTPFLLEHLSGEFISQGEVADVFRPQVALNNDGNAVVVWAQQTAERGRDGFLYIAEWVFGNYFTPGVGWSGLRKLERGYASDAADIQLDLTSDGFAMVAWLKGEIFGLAHLSANWYLPGPDAGWQSIQHYNIASSEASGQFSVTGFADMSTASDATAVVSWVDTLRRTTYVNRFAPSTGWTSPGDSFPDSGDPSTVIAHAGGDATLIRRFVGKGKLGDLVMDHFSNGIGWSESTTVVNKLDNAISNLESLPDEQQQPVIFWEESSGDLFTARLENQAWSSPLLLDNQPGVTSKSEVSASQFGDHIVIWQQDDGAGTTGVWANNYAVPRASGSNNLSPVADAGPDQTVSAGSSVTLDGTGSGDPDGTIVSYQWTQVGGKDTVTLNGANTATPSFNAPSSVKGQSDTLVFELLVTDNDGAQATDQVSITVMK